MGTRFSLNNDSNRVLATQPRTSVSITKFQPPENLQERPYTGSFLIPALMRISQNTNQNQNRTAILADRPSVINQPIAPLPPLIQPNSSPAIESTQHKFEPEQPQRQIVEKSISYSTPSNLHTHHQAMNGDAVVISRSHINLNAHQRSNNLFSSSFRPFRTVVERNGKQFLVEFKERTERRYVQCMDETTHRTRLFEVTDRIPCRIIRPYKNESQSLSQNEPSQNMSLPKLRSDQRSVLPPALNDRSGSVTPSYPVDNRSLNNRANLANGHDIQHNNLHVPPNNKTSQNLPYVSTTSHFSPQSAPISGLTIHSAAHPIYHHSRSSQSNSFYSLSIAPKNVSNQSSSELFSHQPPAFRAHTPTISNSSTYASTATSLDSDEGTETDENESIARILRPKERSNDYEKINPSLVTKRNNTTVSYEINGGYKSPTPVDPFARSLYPSNRHHYRQRPTIQNYAEPVMNNPRFQRSIYPDYAPIPNAIKQQNQNQYSHRDDLLKSGYDG